MPYEDLQDILRRAVGWEKELKDLYDVAEIALRDEKSKKIVALLRDRLVKNLQVLESVNVERYGKTEWVRYTLDFRTDEIVPKTKLKKDSPPKEIFERILESEEKLRDFYSTIRDMLVSSAQQELFTSLVTFKTGQIIEIKDYMDSYTFMV
jgi:rubrerythrin